MKKTEFQQFKSKSSPELEKELLNYQEKLRKLKFDLSQGKVKNISEIKTTKRAIARILTIMNKI